MAAQKRSSYDEEGGGKQQPSPQGDDVVHGAKNGLGEGEKSDQSPESSNAEDGRGDHKEYVIINLSEIRKEVQCPICLGIIRRTRTMMECLHRFCRECIDKSMRLGNNECPACRTHCASRRSLRDDPNYDALIAALYPDIDKFEEEEFTFNEEEIARNKQIQASIGDTIRRQTEGLAKKRQRKAPDFTKGKKKASPSTEPQGSNDNEDQNRDGAEEPSSADEHSAEVRPKRTKRWAGTRSSGACNEEAEIDLEGNKETGGPSCGLIGPSGRLTWGKNGVRSHTRHGYSNGTRNTRVSKLVDYLKNSKEHDDVLNLQVMLVSFDETSVPNLQRPYLRCRPTLSVKHLLQYVALQTAKQTEELELYLVKDLNPKVESSVSAATLVSTPGSIGVQDAKLQPLEEQDTLGSLRPNNVIQGHVLLAYQKRRVELNL